MSDDKITDFLGNVLAIGDRVVYATTQGRSAKLTRGYIVDFVKGGVKVRRTETTGWGQKQVSKRIAYIDKRTGKGIDPSYEKHQERGYGYTHKKTGEFVTNLQRLKIVNYDEVYDERGYVRREGGSYWGAGGRQVAQEIPNPDFNRDDWEFTSPIYKDYVQEVEKEAPPVTVGTANMLKVPDDDA